jgi:hypothetical protein
MRIIDLSVALANDVPADPPFQKVVIDYTGHDQGAVELAGALSPRNCPTARGGRSNGCESRPTTALTWMRRGTTTRRWTAATGR